jgi:fatty acid desaturase
VNANRTFAEISSSSFATEDWQTRELLREFHGVKPAVYWTDFLITAVIGWTALAVAVILRPFSWGMLFAAAVAVAALYRGLCFIHEISHQSKKALPGFEMVWNLLMGYPLLLPSFVYAGVHQSHHKLSTYGTTLDPEYLPFAGNCLMTVLFGLESFLIPLALVIRFLLLSPVGFISPAFQEWLVMHLSSLTMNVAYRREATPELSRKVQMQSGIVLLFWLGLVSLAAAKILPWRFFIVWLGVSAAISFVNTLRTLGAHAYQSSGEPMDREAQLLDSIDTPGALWTELWAPVGLRYHALHHYFPGIPYHDLSKAWRRLLTALPRDAVYHKARSRGLVWSLGALCRRGLRSRAS